jgi:hypothetical protein
VNREIRGRSARGRVHRVVARLAAGRLPQLQHELAELEARKSKAIEAYLYQEKIDRETYEGECTRLNQHIDAKQRQLAANATPELADAVLDRLLGLLTSAFVNWTRFPAALKHRFQGVMFPLVRLTLTGDLEPSKRAHLWA